jgi:hypothetical protein
MQAILIDSGESYGWLDMHRHVLLKLTPPLIKTLTKYVQAITWKTL